MDCADVRGSKEDMEMAVNTVDTIMEQFRRRRDTLKRRIKRIEVAEMEDMRRTNEALRSANALLNERLLAARELRKESDQQRRQQHQGQAQPIGTTLLRY